MQESPTPSWSQSMSGHHDPMVSAPEDDYTSFLDLGDFQLTFPPFDSAAQHNTAGRDESHAMDVSFDGVGDGGVAAKEIHMHQQHQRDLSGHRIHSTAAMQNMDQTSAERLNAQINYLQLHHHQHQDYHRQSVIPPTPDSAEMHAGAATRYYQHQQIDQSLAFLERYHHPRLKEDQPMVFTPLVSPAVTPLDTNFAVSEYTVPGAYFSPLTSPALEAQSHVHRSSYPDLNQYDNSIATSPDMSIDPPTTAVPSTSSPAPPRKPRRKLSTTTRKPPARVVQQSPSTKPQTRRKAPPNSLNTTKGLKDAVEGPPSAGEGSIGPRQTAGFQPAQYRQDSSEGGSISPEPLSEALMAPPPPRSRLGSEGRSHISPNGRTQDSRGVAQGEGGSGLAPATPASLMKLPTPPVQNNTDDRQNGQGFLRGSVVERMIDGSGAPASARSPLPRLDTRNADGQETPTLSGTSRTPVVKPMSTPSSRDHSPQQVAATTPNGISSSRGADTQTNPRGSKKRSSGSVQVSPALRPKISPSIKPLLPEGCKSIDTLLILRCAINFIQATVSAETSALLLASKSNYQNIVEGNNLPGLSYPETLSTNLTSKRTSHKIAEQGRRNRINNALLEIASLLPQDTRRDGGGSSGSGGEAGGGGGGGGGGTQANSKASTVEMAIDYIKALQRELFETKGKLEVAEKKLVGKA
ncbi:MAG: hypothetical protein M1839_003754 [Geoglossum umbratile]|nr:MAG: hypothetical protein M1839_003754 [Geoglossum umbratile]